MSVFSVVGRFCEGTCSISKLLESSKWGGEAHELHFGFFFCWRFHHCCSLLPPPKRAFRSRLCSPCFPLNRSILHINPCPWQLLRPSPWAIQWGPPPRPSPTTARLLLSSLAHIESAPYTIFHDDCFLEFVQFVQWPEWPTGKMEAPKVLLLSSHPGCCGQAGVYIWYFRTRGGVGAGAPKWPFSRGELAWSAGVETRLFA